MKQRLQKLLFSLVVASFLYGGLAACTSPIGGGGGGAPGGGNPFTPLGGLGNPAAPPSNTGGGGGPGGGSGGDGPEDGSGKDNTSYTPVPSLPSDVSGPQADVNPETDPTAFIDEIFVCTFQDKIKIHIKGNAASGLKFVDSQISPLQHEYYEDGRVLRIVDRTGPLEFIETKIKTIAAPLDTEGDIDGMSIGLADKGFFETTMVMKHIPVKVDNSVEPPFGTSNLRFYVAGAGYDPSVLDEMVPCSNVLCKPPLSTHLGGYHPGLLVEAFKNLKSCNQFNLQKNKMIIKKF